MIKHTRAIGIAALIALAVCEAGPALASGPHEESGGRNSVNAMVYFRLPLGTYRAEQAGATSFGFAVQSGFQFAHPAYQREKGAYSMSTTFDLMDLRFGMNGKLSGLDLVGLSALGAKARVITVTDGSGGKN